MSSKRTKQPGSAPGTMVHTGKQKQSHLSISVMNYHDDEFQEFDTKKVEDTFPFREATTVTWININGLHDVKAIQQMGDHFGLHPLLLEDIVSIDQRPKLEDYESYVFIVLKLLTQGKKNRVESEQVSFVLGKNYLLTFQEREGDIFDGVRERIRQQKGRIRGQGADYLAYALIDTVVDHYFVVLEGINAYVERVEDAVMRKPTENTLRDIQRLKRELAFLQRNIWPTRDVANQLLRDENKLFAKSTKVYMRDVYDHTIQLIDTVTASRELVNGMVDIYMTGASNRMNEIMKVLTIIATIFIPLTFITGVYGMNFDHMPELAWRYGYAFALGLMVVMGAAMMYFFKRLHWW